MEDPNIALWNMVDCQLRPNLVSDPEVIGAFLKYQEIVLSQKIGEALPMLIETLILAMGAF